MLNLINTLRVKEVPEFKHHGSTLAPSGEMKNDEEILEEFLWNLREITIKMKILFYLAVVYIKSYKAAKTIANDIITKYLFLTSKRFSQAAKISFLHPFNNIYIIAIELSSNWQDFWSIAEIGFCFPCYLDGGKKTSKG